jgi:hypothetical protein
MTNRDRLIEALRGTAPDAVYRGVLLEQINCPYRYENKGVCMEKGGFERTHEEMCIPCKEDWLSQELEFEMEGITNA